MIRVLDMRNKKEEEVKQMLKEVIMDRTDKFDWENFSLKYNQVFANYDEDEETGDDELSITANISQFLRNCSDCDSFEEVCTNLICDVYIEDGKLVLEDENSVKLYIKDNGDKRGLILFLTESIIKLNDALSKEEEVMNSLFD